MRRGRARVLSRESCTVSEVTGCPWMPEIKMLQKVYLIYRCEKKTKYVLDMSSTTHHSNPALTLQPARDAD